MLQLAEMQLDAIDPTWFASGNTGNVYTDQRYRDVRQATILSFDTTNSFLPGEIRTGRGFDKITQLVGLATHNDQPYVANSGIHAPPTTILLKINPMWTDSMAYLGRAAVSVRLIALHSSSIRWQSRKESRSLHHPSVEMRLNDYLLHRLALQARASSGVRTRGG